MITGRWTITTFLKSTYGFCCERRTASTSSVRRGHAKRLLAGGIAVAVSAASSTALAVNCPTTQSFATSAAGEEAVALFTDTFNSQDYVVLSGANNGLFYATKSTFASTWGPVVTIDPNVSCLSVAAANGVIICSTFTNIAVYQQQRVQSEPSVPAGPPFNFTGQFGPNSSDWEHLAIASDASVWSACDGFGDACYVFGQNGPQGPFNGHYFNYYAEGSVGVHAYRPEPHLGMISAIFGPDVTSPSGVHQSFAFLNSGNCNGSFCTQMWQVVNGLTPLMNLDGTVPFPSGTTPGGIAALSDGVVVGTLSPSSSTPGSVQVYSSGYAQSGSVSPWNLVATLPAPPNATQNFGIFISAAGANILVADFPPSTTNGFNIYTYAVTNPPNNASLAASSFSLTGTLVQSPGAFVASDLCAAYDDPFTGEITLGPIGAVPTNICCSGTICTSQAGTSCPQVQGLTSLYVPTVSGGFAQPTITNNCTAMQAGFINHQADTCTSINFSGIITSPGATYCYPGPFNVGKLVIQCDADPLDMTTGLPADCKTANPGNEVLVRYPVPGSSDVLCCGTPPTQLPADNNTYTCVSQLYQFSSFASGQLLDTDQDTVADLVDNCPFASNPFQQDQDHDLIGDACDNCPAVANQNQKNSTGAAVGDACNCTLPGVKLGPTGAPCSATVVPAVPPEMTGLLGLGLVSAGLMFSRRGRLKRGGVR
jgi:hypothetical protein